MKPPNSFDTWPCHHPERATAAAADVMTSRSLRISFFSASAVANAKEVSHAFAASRGRPNSFNACARLQCALAQSGFNRTASSASDNAPGASPLLSTAWLRLLQ